MSKRQFPNVSNWLQHSVGAQRGAPMGRREYGSLSGASRVCLFRVRLDVGGYDDGGAYWGVPYLQGGKVHHLYCATAPDTSIAMADPATDARAFVRATSRREAMESLGLRPDQLKSKAGL